MLATIRGTVVECLEGKLILEVGPFSFEVFVPLSLNPRREREIKLFTSLFIREENLVLYGFRSGIEKKFFQLALTVPGVGPKLALSLVGGMPLSELARQLAAGNAKALEKIPGVGKKLAQRLVSELKGKAGPFISEGDAPGASEPKAEAVGVLVDLGLDESEAWDAVESFSSGSRSVSELVDLSLKKLGEKKG